MICSGKYANDKAVINYIVKTYTSGGYTQVDALQGVGYLKGDYNLTSKYSLGHYNVNLWAGSSVQNPKVYGETTQIICWITLFISKRQRMILI